MIKSKKQMYIIVGAFIFMLMLFSSTYAFFNYTRTGSTNRIKTGRIAFNSEQGTAMNLTNMFPIDVTGGIPNDATKVGTVTIHVTGDTTYTDGLEYLVTAVNVQNTVGNKTVPISIDVGVSSNTNNDPATTLGSLDVDYYTHRGPSASTSIYKVLAGSTISTDDKLLIGYIKSGATGVDGNIVIRAYLDASKVAISDTYNNGNTPTDNLGTPASFGTDRTIFTTTEWNSLQANGVSFQIKVEANEGVWVPRPLTLAEVISELDTLEETPYGKIYTGNTPNNYVIFNNEQWRIIGVYSDAVNGDKVKIIRNEPISSQIYNSTPNVNSWENSTLETYLNGTYYNSLSYNAKLMIASGEWNAGAVNASDNASQSLSNAELTQVTNKNVGLIASYEYLYAAGNSCWTTSGGAYPAGCNGTDWLWSMLTSNKTINAWIMNPTTDNQYNSLYVHSSYGLMNMAPVGTSQNASPVVYLKSDVIVTGGTGESNGNEYTLVYTSN